MHTATRRIDAADRALSTGSFGDASRILLDGEVLTDGTAWTLGLGRAPSSALSVIYERARLESSSKELPFRPLVQPEGALDWISPVPWPEECYVVTDWRASGAREFLRLHTDVFRFSGFDGALDEGTPQPGDLDRIGAAVELLQRVLPATSLSALVFARLLLILDTEVPSWYQTQSPFTVGLGEGLVRDQPLLVLAECLFHECLHEKYALLRLTRSLLVDSDDDDSGPRALLPWSLAMGERRLFGVNRLLSTLHVYAHLSVLQAALLTSDLAAEHGQVARSRFLTNYERGAYLADVLTWPEIQARLGADGRSLRDWLVAEALDVAAEAAAECGLDAAPYTPTGLDREELMLP